MTSRTSSFSVGQQQHMSRRPSVSSRLSFAVSSAERGGDGRDLPAQHLIEEEIAEIKRYEDFTTIDWVQDSARENLRRKARRLNAEGLYDHGKLTWRYKLWEWYDAAQGWIVVTIIGAAIGFNAAVLSIITEWLSDIKLGYCSTAWYLNEQFCCWGQDNGCDHWQPWTNFAPANYIIYILFATLFSLTAATLVKSIAPYAAGSGISEIKCIIAGFVMKGFLGFWVLVIKSITLPLTIASGLSVGKEGPSVHYAVCAGNVISRLFDKYKRNASKTREILSASAATGVAVAFGSPIGGVLFSLEEMSNTFPLKTMWRSYFCALVGTVVVAAMNPFRTGQLVMFQVSYDRSWHFFEVIFYILIGIFGGVYGAFVMKWNMRVVSFRKKYLANYAVLEATLLALGTAIICYPNAFLRIDMTESMEILFLECEGAEDYHGLCQRDNRWANVASLTFATIIRMLLVIISYGAKIPCGIFVPSMAIGASFGRAVGIIVQALYDANPESAFFAACDPDGPCITPGTYAFLGAAAALSGVMHITISVVVIMFELTGALTYILPTMIVVGVTKAVSDLFGKGGIADRMIWFNGFPFLDNKEDHNFGVSVSACMTTDVVALPVQGMKLGAVEDLLSQPQYQGFPIVEDLNSRVLVGFIGRTELRYAIDRIQRDRPIHLTPETKCSFAPPSQSGANPTVTLTSSGGVNSSASPGGDFPMASLHFSRYIDSTPITVHPRLPLETTMELFRKLGPRVILIEHHGKLVGLVTVKDCIKYQFKVEHAVTPREANDLQYRQEQVWDMIQAVAGWFSGKVSSMSGGRIRLGSVDENRNGTSATPIWRGSFAESRGDSSIMDGDEDLGDLADGVELDNR